MNTCKDCAFWKKGETLIFYVDSSNNKIKKEDFAPCKNKNFIYNPNSWWYGNSQDPKNNAFVYGDGEAYFAFFETGENFGCIHFKLKNT